VHEHIARVMYYFSVQLLYASVVGAAAWVLTSIRGASATTWLLGEEEIRPRATPAPAAAPSYWAERGNHGSSAKRSST